MNPWLAAVLVVGSTYLKLRFYWQIRTHLPPGALRTKLAFFLFAWLWAIGLSIAYLSNKLCT